MIKSKTQKASFWKSAYAFLENLCFLCIIIPKLLLSYNENLKNKLCVILISLLCCTNAIAGSPDIVYYVSDGSDRLYAINRTTGAITNIGPCGVAYIEAIAMWPAPGNNVLYAANASRLGTLSLTTGAFTPLANEFDGGGTADGALGPQSLNDVDGLAFDAWTGILWGSERKSSSGAYDLIFHIDPATGLFVPDAFGPGIDYIVVDGVGVNFDIDDLGINPADGLVYAVSNSGGSDELININKSTGAVTVVADLTYNDVEGLDFHNDAGFYGTTGAGGATALYTIDESTAVMTVLYNPVSGSDLESCAMLVADANAINGTIWHDADSNQAIGGSEARLAGVTVDLYFDANGDGALDAGDFKIQSTTSDGSGDYHFYFGTTGDLLVLIDESTLPVGYAMTTVNNYAVSFTDAVNFGEVSNNNDFGATNGTDCDNDGIPDFAEGMGDSDNDSVLDQCDMDSDNDGIPDNVEGTGDCDGDGILNYKDVDSDNDGIPDAIETNGGIAPVGYDALTGRITGAVGANGMVDNIETTPESGLSILPNTNTDGDNNLDRCDCDSDNDGIVDAIEAGGMDANMDCEIDGFTDNNNDGYHDPFNTTALAIPNTDGLTGPNYVDIDSDNDGIDDTREGYSTPPYQEPIFIIDGDGDGVIDFWDISYGGAPILPYDHDGDSIPDYIDTDSDNDTVLDEIEGFDLDKDGLVDVAPSNNDIDLDGLDDSYDPDTGAFGDFTTMGLQDTDTDGWQDWRDTDDDNDGILTALEPTDVDNNTVVDYLEFTTNCVASGPTFSGNGLLVISNVGFTNPDSTLAAPDTRNARATVSAEIVIELEHLVEHGTDLFVTMSGGANMSIAFSTDNSSWSAPVSGIASGTISFPVSLLAGARYVRLNRLAVGTARMYIDGLAYSFQSCFEDSDGDNIRDNVDVDDDNDGILDVVEVCGALATDFSCIGADPLADDDSDGSPNYQDADFCTLNIHGVCENLDLDSDGIPDFLDLDADNDGIPDVVEAGGADDDGDGLIDGFVDNNMDGITDVFNPCPSCTNIPTPDTDGDGQADFLDLDADNDGIPDVIEAGGTDTNGDGFVDNPTDLDTDGFADVYDSDDDGIAGVEDPTDPLLLTGADTDNDGLPNTYPNGDTDEDGYLDHLDIDADNDGLPDIVEAGGTDINGDGRVDDLTDSDDDGYMDTYDPINETSPGVNEGDAHFVTGVDSGDGTPTIPCLDCDTDSDSNPDHLDIDADNDGIPDIIEAGGTDTDGNGLVDTPTDSDGDGLMDTYDPMDDGPTSGTGNTGDAHFVTGADSGDGTPTIPCLDCDTDGDNNPDHLDIDADNDGIPDIIEAGGTDTDGNGLIDVLTDSDGDGLMDTYDPMDDGPTSGTGNTGDAHFVTGADSGDGTPTSPCPDCDTDGDNYPDYLDLDADNDGIPDIIEAGGTDTDGDGLVDVPTDSDGDGLMDSYDPMDDGPTSGTANTGDAHFVTGADSGDGTPITPCPDCDTDGDSYPDYLDLDADNDGLPDIVEAGGIDTNGDGRVDNLTDSDNDGYTDVVDPSNETTPGINEGTEYFVTGADSGNGTPTIPCATCDTDKDNHPDYLDLDADNDGIPDIVEAGGNDTDGEGRVDANTDSDQDGLADIYDENATDGPGPDGTNGVALVETDGTGTMLAGDDGTDIDTDGDNLPDHLDLDADNDGVPDLIEAGGDDPEGDGLVDFVSVPWDTDGDGLTDLYDTDDNTVAGTADGGDALVMTTDINNDGHVNTTGEEMISGGGGNLPVNLDSDAVANHLDLDADNDGILDVTETGAPDSNNDGYVDNGAGVFVDTDNDGFADNVDGDVGNDFVFEGANPLLITSPDSGTDPDSRLEYTGNGTADSDGDDVPDFLDVDSDNDGIYDNYEGQSTMGYIPPATTDTDGDGLLDAYDTGSGAAQNGITPYNHDSATGDVIPDYLDLDSDADNIPDMQEAWDDLADGDSKGDYVTSCSIDADGDGLLDCYDSNDANAQVYTWAGEPANDVDGVNGTAAGTVFVDNLDVVLPDNIGDNVSEPDYRDNLNACASAQVYYGVSEASSGTSTDYEFNDPMGMHEDGAATSIIRATTYCEPNGDGWYYFYNPLEPENYLFAIKNNAASPNTVAISDLIDYVEIKIAPNPSTRHVIGGSDATLVMERDWSVIYKGTPTAGSSFDVKFYFQPEEMAALDSAATYIVNNATSPVRSDLMWFEKLGGVEDTDILSSGVVGMIDITANDPLGIDEGFSGIPDGTSSTTGNGKNYVEFVGLTDLSGGGTAAVEISFAALPVELSAFSGKVLGCENQISWVTDSEKDFSHFELQRSSDGREFKTIKKIEAQGGIVTKAYQYIDELAEKTSYYRLIMKDLDGSMESSNVIVLTMDCEVKEDAFVVFPNPVAAEEGILNISLDTEVAGEKNFMISDILSRTLSSIPLEVVEGKNRLQLDVSNLPAGTYFLNLIGKSNKVVSKKFIILE